LSPTDSVTPSVSYSYSASESQEPCQLVRVCIDCGRRISANNFNRSGFVCGKRAQPPVNCELCGKPQKESHVETMVPESLIHALCEVCIVKLRLSGKLVLRCADKTRKGTCNQCWMIEMVRPCIAELW